MKKIFFVILAALVPISSFSQTERWVYRYSGVSSWRIDRANSIAYGSDGNLYAAGRSWYNNTRDDFTVISLTDLGVERWIYTYNGLADNNDQAYSVVYGDDGNIYIAGSCYSIDTTRDFTVISLTSAGTERWVYQYNGPGNGPDYAKAVVYGADGNIYVAGNCWSTGGNTDFTVISLTDSGTERWVYQYNGPSDYNDHSISIVYGADGNIYSAGDSYGLGSFEDFTVISLTDSGTERWVYRYNGSGNWADYANSVVYGPDSNIYAIGSTYGLTFDPTVICFDSSGSEQWIYKPPEIGPDGAGAGVYGADGNIYVAGAFGDDISEFMVVSLTDSATRRWEYFYYTPLNSGSEGAYAIVYGEDENIYAAGCIADNITYDDFAVVSLTNSGNERWVYSYDRSREYDFAHAICYGTDSIIYIAGETTDSITGGDFTVISLDPVIGIEENRKMLDAFQSEILYAYPNPFHNIIKIKFNRGQNIENGRIVIYDVTGRVLKTFNQLTNQIVWDGTNNLGHQVSEGVYFMRLQTPDFKEIKKIILLK